MKTFALAALVASISALANAQTSTIPSPSMGTILQQGTGSTMPTVPGSGGTIQQQTTISQALMDKLRGQGYSDISLSPDASSALQGQLAGTAVKGGKKVNLQITSDGTIIEK
jgi:hypothetical protein